MGFIIEIPLSLLKPFMKNSLIRHHSFNNNKLPLYFLLRLMLPMLAGKLQSNQPTPHTIPVINTTPLPQPLILYNLPSTLSLMKENASVVTSKVMSFVTALFFVSCIPTLSLPISQF